MVVQVKARWELRVAAAFESMGCEVCCPTVTLKQRAAPVIPGYVFVRPQWHRIEESFESLTRVIPGFIRVLEFEARHAEIDALRRVTSSGLTWLHHPFLKVGRRVQIVRGPLSGIEGILIDLKARARVVVSIHFLQTSIATEVDSADIIQIP